MQAVFELELIQLLSKSLTLSLALFKLFTHFKILRLKFSHLFLQGTRQSELVE